MTNEELCTEARKSKKALDLLYEQNQGLINKICRKISGQFEIEYEEAVQEAAFGFMDAVKNYEPESGVKFSTFLAKCVFNAIKEYAKKEKRQNEKCPILTYTEFEPDTYKINIFNPVDSDEITLYAIEINEYHLTPEEAFFVKYKRETVRNAVKNLGERHRQYISFRFGLEDDIEHSKSKTAEHFDISIKEAAKLENEALKQMRKFCVPFFACIVNDEINILNGKQFESRFNNSTQFCGMFFHLVSENNAGSKCVYSFAFTNITDEEITGEMNVDFEENSFEIHTISDNISGDNAGQISDCLEKIFQSLIYNYLQLGRLPNGMIITEKYT